MQNELKSQMIEAASYPWPNEAETGSTGGSSRSAWNGDRQDGIWLHMKTSKFRCILRSSYMCSGFVCPLYSQERSVQCSLWSHGLWFISSWETPAPRHDTGLTELYLGKAAAGHFRAPQVSLDAYLWATELSPRLGLKWELGLVPCL